MEDVRNSIEGYVAGSSLPYSKATSSRQPYLMSMLHKWRCEKLGRTRAMPHLKTYSAFNDGETKPIWLIVTSANLSKVFTTDWKIFFFVNLLSFLRCVNLLSRFAESDKF